MNSSRPDSTTSRPDPSTSTGRPSHPTTMASRTSRDASPEMKRDAPTSQTAVSATAVGRTHSTSLSTPSLPPSSTTSPQTSRTTSPTRPTARSIDVARTSATHSRKGSHDASPVRPPGQQSTSSGPPSAAAIQRALSAANMPQMTSSSSTSNEQPSKLPRTSRSHTIETSAAGIGPALSPRVKSPGPSAPSSRRNSVPRKVERPIAPPITVQSSTPPSSVIESTKETISDPVPLQTPKGPSRGPSGPKSNLETVQEATPPSGSVLSDMAEQDFHNMKASQSSSKTSGNPSKMTGLKRDAETSGKASAGDVEATKIDNKPKVAPTSQPDQSKSKLHVAKTSLSGVRGAKQVEGAKNMTVETETVASIPQSALVADRSASNRTEAGGSIRLKPSTETIRPRKERKRVSRKAPSIHNGTASSKADIFEARVASQVDEAESSDSDETFVYESNPPEPQLRSHRNHSRTPSVTSVQSQSDRRLYRAYENHRVAGKRSMKFSNNPYNVLDSPTDGETGTIRAHHPRNISRFGRTIGSNSSLYDQDSPFTQASKLRQNLTSAPRQSSRPTTPQGQKSNTMHGQGRQSAPWARKEDDDLYDFDGEGADDERAPLIGTVRTPRNRHMRRIQRPYDHMYNVREGSWLVRYGGCLFGTIVVFLILLGAFGFLFMSNRSMYEVEISQIRNVLASEQEIMLDITVGAINPNVLGVSITEMDLNLFAKSKHLATTTVTTTVTTTPTAMPSSRPVNDTGILSSSKPRAISRVARHVRSVTLAGTPWQDPSGHWHDSDDPAAPPSDSDSQTMLLGRVFHFDSGLFFEGSPVKRHAHYSVGEFRLTKPGNHTETGGSARWERVVQHEFELILRGVLRYQLPISNREQTAAVSGSVIVDPADTGGDEGFVLRDLKVERLG